MVATDCCNTSLPDRMPLLPSSAILVSSAPIVPPTSWNDLMRSPPLMRFSTSLIPSPTLAKSLMPASPALPSSAVNSSTLKPASLALTLNSLMASR